MDNFPIKQSKSAVLYFKKISLNNLLLNPIDGFIYMADIDDRLEYNNIHLIQPGKLPEQYIPEEDSFYDFESELDKDSKLLLLNHIFDGREIVDILLKLLNKYQY